MPPLTFLGGSVQRHPSPQGAPRSLGRPPHPARAQDGTDPRQTRCWFPPWKYTVPPLGRSTNGTASPSAPYTRARKEQGFQVMCLVGQPLSAAESVSGLCPSPLYLGEQWPSLRGVLCSETWVGKGRFRGP